MEDKLRAIKMILLDVDGVMTDGRLIYSDNGTEAKSFDVKDGFAIRIASLLGLRFGIITGKMSSIVERRAKELGIEEVHQEFLNKHKAYTDIKQRLHLEDEDLAFIGDDLFDLKVLERVGFSACPSDAVEEVKKTVDYITRAAGGRGAVREVIEMVLKAQNKWGVLFEHLENGPPVPAVK